MIEILSLPRRPQQDVGQLPRTKSTTGLPINSLPGWEHIPLNLKLPMLKCPGNQVIFSKNKIGKSIQNNRQMSQEFVTCGQDSYPEYNALHDSNLRTFYANERNLKRLRANGEITQQNDVICNLKDFNEYRHQLHKSQLYYILQEMSRLEGEQHDRLLVARAEHIAGCAQQSLTGREHNYIKVRLRKSLLDRQKIERFKKLWETVEEKFSNIRIAHSMNMALIERRKVLRQLRMRKHRDVRNDLQRKQLISLKKLLHMKNDRMQKNLIKLQENQESREEAQQTASWNKRLAERISNQGKMRDLLQKVDCQRRAFIENHMAQYSKKWLLIERQIKERSLRSRQKTKCRFRPRHEETLKISPQTANGNRSMCMEFQGSFDKLLDDEVCRALNTVLDLEQNIDVPFAADDPIYKAAQFIMQHILADFHQDLTSDSVAYNSVYERIENFFTEAKKFVIFRSTQIISAARDSLKEFQGKPTTIKSVNNGGIQRTGVRNSTLGRVSFSKMSSTIGISSYEIHPLIEVRDVGDRKPTPAGSLDSIVVDSTTSLAQKTPSTNLCRNELVFIEHYVTKFKRELLVGIGRRVFAAIECHFEDKIMDVRQELLDMDRKFLINQATKSILGYGINPLNFASSLRLCISALSSDIIWSLQKVLLRPARDVRRIVKPQIRCHCLRDTNGMCLYCRSIY